MVFIRFSTDCIRPDIGFHEMMPTYSLDHHQSFAITCNGCVLNDGYKTQMMHFSFHANSKMSQGNK